MILKKNQGIIWYNIFMKNKLADSEDYFATVDNLLRQALGEPEVLHESSPLAYCQTVLDVLIATVLTQATSDRNALKSWQQFKQTFPEPELVLKADESTLKETIRSGGLANQKAKTIRAILRTIQDQGYSFDEIGNDQEFLRSLPGVGPKTLACVLLFGLKIPAFPVDTHIHRIALRMGWVEPSIGPAETQQLLTRLIPAQYHFSLHILLLNLGRRYCRPHNPKCQGCPLDKVCCKVF